jgi:excisionase family DNA binding protein
MPNWLDDELLTPTEVSKTLRVTRQTVYNYIDSGRLPAVRVGVRRVRILRSDLGQLIQQGYRGFVEPTADFTAADFWDGVIREGPLQAWAAEPPGFETAAMDAAAWKEVAARWPLPEGVEEPAGLRDAA